MLTYLWNRNIVLFQIQKTITKCHQYIFHTTWSSEKGYVDILSESSDSLISVWVVLSVLGIGWALFSFSPSMSCVSCLPCVFWPVCKNRRAIQLMIATLVITARQIEWHRPGAWESWESHGLHYCVSKSKQTHHPYSHHYLCWTFPVSHISINHAVCQCPLSVCFQREAWIPLIALPFICNPFIWVYPERGTHYCLMSTLSVALWSLWGLWTLHGLSWG